MPSTEKPRASKPEAWSTRKFRGWRTRPDKAHADAFKKEAGIQ